MYTPTQAQLLAQNRAELQGLHKQRYRKLIGMGFAAIGAGAAFAGLPMAFSVAMWFVAGLAWTILGAAQKD